MIYNPFRYYSIFLSILDGRLKIFNPLALLWNILAFLVNIERIGNKLNKNVDLVITKGLMSHIPSGIVCKKLKIPVIWHLQDYIKVRFFGLTSHIFNYFAKTIPTKIVCDGEKIKESLGQKLFFKTKVQLNAVDRTFLKYDNKLRNQIRHEFKIPKNAYVIGHLARITSWKGQEYLLKAFIKYSKLNPNAYLLMVGSPLFDNDKYFKYLKNMIYKSDLTKKVIMPGYRDDLNKIYSSMDLFFCTSIEKDTSPLSLISGIVFGLPVAISNIDTLKEIKNICPEIKTFEPSSIKQIVDIIKKYESPEKRIVDGRKNRKLGKKHFNILTFSKNMNKTITSILANSK